MNPVAPETNTVVDIFFFDLVFISYLIFCKGNCCDNDVVFFLILKIRIVDEKHFVYAMAEHLYTFFFDVRIGATFF
ncbi:hypothetical protein PP707_06685 [Acetobacter pasteurianus]|nr:hypothetical protein [Acetobacter pasteurianus]